MSGNPAELGSQKYFFWKKFYFHRNAFLGVSGVAEHEYDIHFAIWGTLPGWCQHYQDVVNINKISENLWKLVKFYVLKVADHEYDIYFIK